MKISIVEKYDVHRIRKIRNTHTVPGTLKELHQNPDNYSNALGIYANFILSCIARFALL